MWNSAQGFMAIWSDVAPADLALYHDWLLKEHFPERVGIAGFVAARVFGRAAGADRQFFILYETQSPAVLASPAYMARLNAPTKLSQQIMPRLKNFVRGAGRVVQSSGLFGGGAVRALRFAQPHKRLSDALARGALLDNLVGTDGVVAARLFEVDTAATSIPTAEKKMRSGTEAIYSQLLVIEAVDEEACAAVSPALAAQLDTTLSDNGAPFDQTYRLIGELQGCSLN
jgi:hypothetical protein